MPKSSKTIGKIPYTAYIDKDASDEIARRTTKIKRSKSEFIGDIIKQWFDGGAPYVDEIDRVMNERETEDVA